MVLSNLAIVCTSAATEIHKRSIGQPLANENLLRVLDLFTRAEEHFSDALKVVTYPMTTRHYPRTMCSISLFKTE